MIVTKDIFSAVLRDLKEGASKKLAVDCETTSLRPYHGGVPFSVIIASSAQKAFYFNFNMALDIPLDAQLDRYHADALNKLLNNPKNYLFLHNAKFDWGMLNAIGIELGGTIHDTMVVERLLFNDAQSISLANCAKRIGFEKDSVVSDYIKKHKLHTVTMHGTKEVKNLHYDQVPFELMSQYALTDAKITYALGESQIKAIEQLGQTFRPLVNNEFKLLKTVYAMEQRGVKIDRPYCERAIAHEHALIQKSIDEFKALTGKEFKDSGDLYSEIFKDEEIKFGLPTKTGQVNPVFDNYALEGFKSPIAKHILDYRATKKRLDFYESFLYYADHNDVLHAGFNQAGTATGRFSAWDPNLQQLKKDEGDDLKQEFVVRRAIVPRDGYMFLMLDYQQVEYKLMLDLAGAHGLIAKVKDGLDVHQATADIAGVTRKEAKTVNFAILYGAGAKKIAKSLGVDEAEALRLKNVILNASPEIKVFIRDLIGKAKRGGLLVNWFYRQYRFADPNFAYRAPNHLIQGGSADVMKIAMNRVCDYLKDRKSKLVLTIHDELVIELHESEKFIVPKLKDIMETVYEGRYLQLTCTAEYSWDNLADKQKMGTEVN